jgi:hypothetical protein
MGACGVPTAAPATTSAPGARPWIPLLLVLGGPVLLYPPLVGYRWDYLSHFLIGAATVLGAVGLSRLAGRPGDALAVVTAAGVLAASALTEHRWFGALVFDWADIGVGGLGACCAAAALVGRRDGPPGWALVVLAGALGLVGLVVRFGLDGVPS